MKLVGFQVKPKKKEKEKAVKQRGTSHHTAVHTTQRRRKKRKKRTVRPVAVLSLLLMAALVVIALLAQQLIAHNFVRRDDAHLTYVDDIPVHEDFLEEGAAGRPGEKRRIQYVVIHETDNTKAGANAAAHDNFIHSNGQTEKLSWHYTVDDHEIWHHIPDDETAYHAGDGMENDGGNKNGIGVEMCVNSDGDYEKTLKNAQKLAAHLLYEYGLDMDTLKKHQDFSGKNCPSRLLNDGRWEEFRQGVQEQLARLTEKADSTAN